MIKKLVIGFIMGLCTLCLSACTTRHTPPPAPAPGLDGLQAWSRVLEKHVAADGTIDFRAIADQRRDLEAMVHYVAATDWERLERDEQLAYHINAYNALAMWNVIVSDYLPEQKFSFFFRQKFNIGGQYMNLYNYENQVIRELGEPRVHFALNCMVKSCPRLPAEPFRADTLDAQLEAVAKEFCNSPQHVQVDRAARELKLSAIFIWYKKDYLTEATSLPDYINRYREPPVPLDYTVVKLPYDWTLNGPPPEAG